MRVPAKPDSLNSPDIEESDAEFARRFHTGVRWTDFPLEVKWIVELETRSGATGIGETYRDVSADQIEAALRTVQGFSLTELRWSALPVANPRVYDAIESAVMDAAGKMLGVPVYQLLGGAHRTRIECSGWTGRRTPEDAARKAAEAMEQGHRVFKFKCSDDDPVREWVDAIGKRCGNRIRVLLDPNQRWRDAETTLRLMDGVPTEMMFGLEDPVLRSDIHVYGHLRRRLGVPMFLHVALPYSQDANDLLRAIGEQAVDGFNINGSMFAFTHLARTAALAGKPVWHGSEVDLGILEASALHACAAVPNCTIPSDLFGELVREDDLIQDGIRFENGCAVVPDGPGLGVELDRDALEKYRAGEPISC